ncbi:MAG TPA: NUDIX domain-containing protein [Candidatus Saccharimonadales bacterium]
MKYTTPYVAPILTVDAVIFQLIDGVLSVLLLRRPNEPFKGSWALPGGYNPEGETTMQALERIIADKAGVSIAKDLSYVEQLYTFDTVARDPRGHAVSVTYMGCGRTITPTNDENIAFLSVNNLPDLAYDHADIIRYAHERLIAKLSYTNAVYAFLPSTFTLAELQSAYEAIFGYELDKRNFRKKFLSLNLIHETDKMKREGAHRPAKLYSFNQHTLESLPRSFE